MKKSLLIKEVAQKSGITVEEAKEIIDNMLDIIIDRLKYGEGVNFNGFGSFKINNSTPREVYIPGTNKKVLTKNSKRIRFVPSNVLKAVLNEGILR